MVLLFLVLSGVSGGGRGGPGQQNKGQATQLNHGAVVDEIFEASSTKQREAYRWGFTQALTAAGNKGATPPSPCASTALSKHQDLV